MVQWLREQTRDQEVVCSNPAAYYLPTNILGYFSHELAAKQYNTLKTPKMGK